MATSIFKRPFDLLMLIFFIIHIPTTLLVDVQSILPQKWFPSWAVDAVNWHVAKNGDHLVGRNPVWFVSFVWGELVLQLPAFFILSYGLIKEARWVRIPCIIYGTHVATTVVPMLAEFLFSKDVPAPNYVGAAVYLPYFLIAFALMVRMSVWDYPSQPLKVAKRKSA